MSSDGRAPDDRFGEGTESSKRRTSANDAERREVVGPDPADAEVVSADFVAVEVSSAHAGFAKRPAQLRPRGIEEDEAMYWDRIVKPRISNEDAKHDQVPLVRAAGSLDHIELRFVLRLEGTLKSGHQMV